MPTYCNTAAGNFLPVIVYGCGQLTVSSGYADESFSHAVFFASAIWDALADPAGTIGTRILTAA